MVLNTICGCLPARVGLALLCATGVMVLYMVRINLSVAIVAMVHVPISKNVTRDKLCVQDDDNISTLNMTQKAYNSSLGILPLESQEDEIYKKIIMSSTEKGSVLGGLFYGYVTTAIIGGRASEMYGTKIVFGVSMLMGGLLTLLTPIAAQTNYACFMAVRVLIGVFQGVIYPSMHCLMSRWIPPLERPRFMSFVYVANCLGIVITLPICGVIIDAVGWPWVFYGTGIVSLVWVAMWFLMMHDTPQQHPRISQAELKYITDALSRESSAGVKPKNVPWLEILKCRGLWAITICHTGNMYGWNLLNTQLPSYMAGVLGLNIKKNAVMSSIPFLTRFIGSNVWSWVGDTINTKGILSRRVSRRIFSTLGLVGMAVVLSIVGFMGCNVNIIVFLLALGTFCGGATTSGYAVNHLDLAPNFAGTMLGVSNTCAFLVAMLAPVFVGALTPDQTPEQWQAAFLSTSGILMVSIIVYLLFADLELKPWNFASLQEAHEGEEAERQEFIQKKTHGSHLSLADI